MPLTSEETKLKKLLKAAVVEVLEERRDLVRDALAEAVEDIGLVRAIEAGSRSRAINRADVSSFSRDVKAIKNKTVLESITKLIETVEAAQNLRAIPDVKKLKAKGDYYRIKLGDYRVGITLNKDKVTFVRCLDWKEIYRYFP